METRNLNSTFKIADLGPNSLVLLRNRFLIMHLFFIIVVCGGTLVVHFFSPSQNFLLPLAYGCVASFVNMIVLSELVLALLLREVKKAAIFFLLKSVVFIGVILFFVYVSSLIFLVGYLSFLPVAAYVGWQERSSTKSVT